MKAEVIVVGAGAAGIFGAISIKEHFPNAKVRILEKTSKVLSKVKVSGGGRCNVTHACFENSRLVKNYPRGNKSLRKPFNHFSTTHTIEWFEKRGVKLKTESDGRMFPVTDSSQTIIDCLLSECKRKGIEIITSCGVKNIKRIDNQFEVLTTKDEKLKADRVLIATGGNPKKTAYEWLADLGHTIESPVPSLFTFNVPSSEMKDLAGISVPEANVRIEGSKLEYEGPLLVTHWGFSGPAVLKLSAFGARELEQNNYKFRIHVRWFAEHTEEQVRKDLQQYKAAHPKKIIGTNPLFDLPKRLWMRLTELADISSELRWLDLPKKNFNKLVEMLVRAAFEVNGKTTFKEEFVTCGGVSIREIHLERMESKKCPGLYFAGEVMDVDGITGGFNFQHAWSSAFLAGRNILNDQEN